MTEKSDVKFLHYRQRGANGVINARGGLTIAYRDLSEQERNFALALCSRSDNFCKERGRTLATHRLGGIFSQTIASDAPTFVAYADAMAHKMGYERKFSGKRERKKGMSGEVASNARPIVQATTLPPVEAPQAVKTSLGIPAQRKKPFSIGARAIAALNDKSDK